MTFALDRLVALATGGAPVFSLRPAFRFEHQDWGEEHVEVEAPEVAGAVSAAPELPRTAPVAPPLHRTVDPAPSVAGRRPRAAAVRVHAASGDGAKAPAAPAAESPGALPAPVPPPLAAAPVLEAAGVEPRPAPGVPPRDVIVPGPLPRTSRKPSPHTVRDPHVPDPRVLLEEHILPVLVREQVVAPTAVPGPTGRTDVEVVEVPGEARVETEIGDPPQVHVHIGEVRVRRPDAPTPRPDAPTPRPRPDPPDLDAYLAARRDPRP
jgi:hypothetical protein